MKKWTKTGILFTLGGGMYVAAEKLWRGRSHGSMFFAGGTAFLLLGQLGRLRGRVSRPARMILGAGAITAVEFVTGCLVNRRWQVWDYRGRPGNYLGQVCPEYCGLWLAAAAVGEGLYTLADEALGPVSRKTAVDTCASPGENPANLPLMGRQ